MRIALATVGTTGDVLPFATLAGALAARGHDVTAVTWPVHADVLRRPGVHVEVAGPHAEQAAIDAVAADAARRGPMDQVAALRDFHLADGEAHLRRLRTLLGGHDLVLLHGIHSLAHAAVLDTGARWSTAVFDPVLLPTSSAPPPGLPNLGPANRVLWRLLDAGLARVGRPLDDLLARSGSTQRKLPLFRARSSLLHLVACSPSMVRVLPDLPRGTRVSGAWIDGSAPNRLPAEVEDFIAAGAKPVIITFGSMRGVPVDVLESAARAAVAAGHRVIVQGATAGESLSRDVLRIGSVDHRALFEHAALVVHHGGAGTSHAVVAAGVPSVVVPQIGDQHYWAQRLEALGAAPAPLRVKRLEGERLAAAIDKAVRNRSMRDAVQALATRVRGEDGVARSVELLEGAATPS